MNNFAKNLIELRKLNSHTQDYLASKVFVTRQAVSKWERGKSLPDADVLIALSKLYGVSIDELLLTDVTAETLSAKKETNEQKPTDEKDFEHLKKQHRKKLAVSMTVWALCLFAVYALVCGIVQTAFINISTHIWLIWFTYPIVPPIVFALRFYHEITPRFIMFFLNVPFLSGLIFELILLAGNRDGAWIAFLLIPFYYAIAITVAVLYKKKNKQNAQKLSDGNNAKKQ